MAFRSIAFLAITASLGAAACAEERPAIDRVQPDVLPKAFFIGEDFDGSQDDPEFYMQGTLVDVGFGAIGDGLFTSTYGQPLSRIKFQVTENLLIARITYERIPGSDGKGAGAATNDGVIAATFRITSHFDITKAYNSTTGEQLNITEENSSDRPWYARKYMRVDWSTNLATDTYDFDTLAAVGMGGGVKYTPLAYHISDPKDPDAPYFDAPGGYFDVTTKAFAEPQEIDISQFGWGIDSFPACYLEADFLGGSFPSGNCNPSELTIRHSFMKIRPGDYEPQDWDGYRFQAFGPFMTERYGYARNYGMTDEKWHRFIARYNIWERHHFYSDAANMKGEVPCFTPLTTAFGEDPHRDLDQDGTEDECQVIGRGSHCDEFSQKCTLPYRDRLAKPVTWYYSEKSDTEYFEASAAAAHQWDVALRSAVMVARRAECQRTRDEDCAQYPVYNGQADDHDDAMDLAGEVDDCRNGRAYLDKNQDRAACDALADSLGAARSYAQGVIALARMDEMIVLCHSPVEASDPAACGGPRLPEGVAFTACVKPATAELAATCDNALRVRRGDLRFHQVNVIKEPQNESPWGIYSDSHDPLTGEKIGASINVWSSVTDGWAQRLVDTARYIGGELPIEAITEGEYIKDWSKASEAASNGGILPRLTRAELEKRVGAYVGRPTSAKSGGKAGKHAVAGGDARPFAAAAKVKQELRHVVARVGVASANAPMYAARRQAALGTEVEAALLTPMMQALAGVAGLPLGGSILNAASPLRGANPSIQRDYRNLKELGLAHRGACVLDEAPVPLGIANIGKVLQAKFGNFDASQSKAEQQVRAERMRRYIASLAHTGVIGHEMGHSMGHRHNFVSSSDAWGYRPQYWQLRTKNGALNGKFCTELSADGEDCVGPRYFDPVTPNERDNHLNLFMQSSIMEYPGDVTQEFQRIGAYDFAATHAFYGDAVAVFQDPDYPKSNAYIGAQSDPDRVGGSVGQGLHAKMDNFGGILGWAPQIGPDEIHYTQLQETFQLIRNCRAVDPSVYRPAAWDTATMGEWDATFDGHIVQVDGQYTTCDTVPVDYAQWGSLRQPTILESGGGYEGGPTIDCQGDTACRDPKTAEDVAKGRVRVPYGFASDEWADVGNVAVYRMDNGADPYELFDFLISQQEVGHIFDNYRRGRQDFSVRAAANRGLSRYTEKLRDAAKGLGLIKNIYEHVAIDEGWNFDDFWPAVSPGWFPQNVLTAGMAFDHFARLLARPQSGGHYLPVGDDVYRSNQDAWGTPTAIKVVVPNGATGFYQNAGFGGRPLENMLSSNHGEYDRDYVLNAGSYYDKTWAALLMTESVDNFISSTRGDFYDPRYRAVSVADVFPDGYRRWLGNNLTGDDMLKGPRVAANAGGVPVVDGTKYPKTPIGWVSWWVPSGPEVCFPNSNSQVCSSYGEVDTDPYDPAAPANVAVLDPQVGWEQQKFLIAWTLVYLPENEQQWWLDQLRLWEIGAEANPGIANRIEFHFPGGKTYVARTFGTEAIFGKVVQKGVAARVLEYANELMAEAYETTTKTGPDGTTWYEAVLDAKTGQPLVKYDPNMAAVDAEGYFQDGKDGCDTRDNSKCTCAANRACTVLRQYVAVPAFLHQATSTFLGPEPSWQGIY